MRKISLAGFKMKLALIALTLVEATLVSAQEKPGPPAERSSPPEPCFLEIDVVYKGSKAGLDHLDIGKQANEVECRDWCRYLKILITFYDVGHKYGVSNYLRLILF